jgi:hypothetical protein
MVVGGKSKKADIREEKPSQLTPQVKIIGDQIS